MADVHIAIGYTKIRTGRPGAQVSVRSSIVSRSEILVSNTTSQQSTMIITPQEFANGALWFITPTGGSIDVSFGANPVANTTNTHRILDSSSTELTAVSAGEKLAFKNA